MYQDLLSKSPSIGQIFSISFKIFRENILQIIIVVFLIYFPINIISNFVLPDELTLEQESLTEWRSGYQIVSLLEGLIGILVPVAITFMVKATLEEKKINAMTALKNAVGTWGRVLGTTILSSLALFVLFLLLIVPGVIYSIYWAFIIPIVIFKDKWAKEAMDYSKMLVKGKWWKIFGYFLLFVLLAILVYMIVFTFFYFFYSFFPENNIVVNLVVDSLIDIVFAFHAVFLSVLFLNLDSSRQN